MNTIAAIAQRRSIRRYTGEQIPRAAMEQIIQAAIDAPSAKNGQPWRFVIVTAEGDRSRMIGAMREGLLRREQEGPQDEGDTLLMKGAWHTLGIMEQAPVTVLILNPEGKHPFAALTPFGERFAEMANMQSLGAAIENMCLAATELGLGSLWICDIFAAYDTLTEWLDTKEQLVAALSIGCAAEAPEARPRKAIQDVTSWR